MLAGTVAGTRTCSRLPEIGVVGRALWQQSGLSTAGIQTAVFRGLNMVFMLPMSFNEHRDAAQHIDDTARRGFGDHGS